MSSQRSFLPTEITEGKQIAVAGTVSFYPPQGNGSILVDEVRPIEEDGTQRFYEIIPVSRQQLIVFAVAIVIVLVVVIYFLLGGV